jgi:hypothetical protein
LKELWILKLFCFERALDLKWLSISANKRSSHCSLFTQFGYKPQKERHIKRGELQNTPFSQPQNSDSEKFLIVLYVLMHIALVIISDPTKLLAKLFVIGAAILAPFSATVKERSYGLQRLFFNICIT